MKPGRELDALIAEKVMGYRDINTGGLAPLPVLIHPDWFTTDAQNGVYQTKELFDRLTQIPRYSTDISAAWEVVEKIKDRYEPDYSFQVGVSANQEWWAGWAHHEYYHLGGNGSTAPHAICLAALRACQFVIS